MRAMKGDEAVAIGHAGGAELTAEGKDMTQKERMLANLPYKAWLDGLKEERVENCDAQLKRWLGKE